MEKWHWCESEGRNILSGTNMRGVRVHCTLLALILVYWGPLVTSGHALMPFCRPVLLYPCLLADQWSCTPTHIWLVHLHPFSLAIQCTYNPKFLLILCHLVIWCTWILVLSCLHLSFILVNFFPLTSAEILVRIDGWYACTYLLKYIVSLFIQEFPPGNK